ncbi:unnamed protein product [Vitrella brassicaformis CCMP3155]|uniref:Uncharacterized protein n=1 Tax=Vitrella brassicaformis (strain CCMP3155) TaxID=1169540 RepID=A0A0G4E933_VITBC|nr:unnamed protein product [Vitrella brassicaformis CCMP3155]|eukprot:CEL91711.1 unnamed protein product [Vitrella brassicaformis CCMP3155]
MLPSQSALGAGDEAESLVPFGGLGKACVCKRNSLPFSPCGLEGEATRAGSQFNSTQDAGASQPMLSQPADRSTLSTSLPETPCSLDRVNSNSVCSGDLPAVEGPRVGVVDGCDGGMGGGGGELVLGGYGGGSGGCDVSEPDTPYLPGMSELRPSLRRDITLSSVWESTILKRRAAMNMARGGQ